MIVLNFKLSPIFQEGPEHLKLNPISRTKILKPTYILLGYIYARLCYFLNFKLGPIFHEGPENQNKPVW